MSAEKDRFLNLSKAILNLKTSHLPKDFEGTQYLRSVKDTLQFSLNKAGVCNSREFDAFITQHADSFFKAIIFKLFLSFHNLDPRISGSLIENNEFKKFMGSVLKAFDTENNENFFSLLLDKISSELKKIIPREPDKFDPDLLLLDKFATFVLENFSVLQNKYPDLLRNFEDLYLCLKKFLKSKKTLEEQKSIAKKQGAENLDTQKQAIKKFTTQTNEYFNILKKSFEDFKEKTEKIFPDNKNDSNKILLKNINQVIESMDALVFRGNISSPEISKKTTDLTGQLNVLGSQNNQNTFSSSALLKAAEGLEANRMQSSSSKPAEKNLGRNSAVSFVSTNRRADQLPDRLGSRIQQIPLTQTREGFFSDKGLLRQSMSQKIQTFIDEIQPSLKKMNNKSLSDFNNFLIRTRNFFDRKLNIPNKYIAYVILHEYMIKISKLEISNEFKKFDDLLIMQITSLFDIILDKNNHAKLKEHFQTVENNFPNILFHPLHKYIAEIILGSKNNNFSITIEKYAVAAGNLLLEQNDLTIKAWDDLCQSQKEKIDRNENIPSEEKELITNLYKLANPYSSKVEHGRLAQ